MTRVVGYTADADTYCKRCAAELYPAHCTRCGMPGKLFDPGWHDIHECNEQLNQQGRYGGSPGYFAAYDSEGSEVHAIFRSDEWDSPVHCAHCHTLLHVDLTSDGVEYVKDALDAGDGDPEVLAEWAEEYRWELQQLSPDLEEE